MAKKITLSWTDDNFGAGDDDGYRLYRGAESDPLLPNGTWDSSADIVLDKSSTDADWIAGSGNRTHEDTSVVEGVNYFYRLETRRGATDKAVSAVVGPLKVKPMDDFLGYPNNTPSNTDKVKRFINTEPFIHFDAAWQSTFNEVADATDTSAGTTQGLNKPYSNQQITESHSTYPRRLKLHPIHNIPYFHHTHTGYYWASIQSYDSRSLLFKPEYGVEGIYDAYIYDQGVSVFLVAPSHFGPLINGNYANQFSHSTGFYVLQNSYGTNGKNYRASMYNVSDGSTYEHPNKPGNIDYRDFGKFGVMHFDPTLAGGAVNHYNPNRPHYAFGIAGNTMRVYPDPTMSQSSGYGLTTGKWELTDNNTAGSISSYYTNDPAVNKLSIICANIQPDGSTQGFFNGNLVAYSNGELKSYINQHYVSKDQKDNGHAAGIADSLYENQTLKYGKLTTGSALVNPSNYATESLRNVNEYAEGDPFRAAGLSEVIMKNPPINGGTRGNFSYMEYIVVPKALSPLEFISVGKYLENKYSGKLETQSYYNDIV